MILEPAPLKGAFIINLEKKEDYRGFFSRFWCKKLFKENSLDTQVKQINTSMSIEPGTLRGLHFQVPPKAETKILRCIQGSIWDVIVDVRKYSKTYGKHYGLELSSTNRTMILIPQGFAHGFISLRPNSEVIYLVSEYYSKEHERGLRWDDPFHNINWPTQPKIISKKDLNIPLWKDELSIEL